MSRSPSGPTPQPPPLDEASARALIHQGWDQLQRQQPLAAWGSWQRALRLDPDNRAAREAIERLESANDLPLAARRVARFRTPGDPARRGRWDATLRGRDLGALPDAADAFAQLALDDPEDARAWYNRALCLAWLGRNAEAISCLDRVVHLQAGPDFEEAVASWSLAEVLRQGAGAEHLADDLRYALVVDWDASDTGALLARYPEIQEIPMLVDPVSGKPQLAEGRVFEWLERPSSEATIASNSPSRVLATVLITPGTLRLSSPDREDLELAVERLDRVLTDPSRIPRREVAPLPLALLDAAALAFRIPRDLDPAEAARLSREGVEHYYEDRWIHQPRHGLDDRSPLEASRLAGDGDPVARARLTAVVEVREQLGARPRTAGLYHGYPFDRLRRRLGLETRDASSFALEDLSCMSEAELDRLDPKGLDDDRLADAFESALGLRLDTRTARFAAELLGRDSPALGRLDVPSLLAPLVRESLAADDPRQALDWLEKGKRLNGGRDLRTFATWSFEILVRTGDPEAALRSFQQALEGEDLDPAQLLDAAEEMIQAGHHEQAGTLLAQALDRAGRVGDVATLARVRLLSGEDVGRTTRRPDESSP